MKKPSKKNISGGKKTRRKNTDLILNMLPSKAKDVSPVPKQKKKTLTEMGTASKDSVRFLSSMSRSHSLGVITASQFSAPLMDGLILPTGQQINQINASKNTGGEKGGNGLTINAANTATMMPFFHTPGNAQDAYNLPKTYVEQIRWSRLMYNLNAYIGAITDLKAFYGLSKFKLRTAEPAVTEFYAQVAFNKNFNLYDHILRMSLNYQKFGESIAWGARKAAGTWPKTGQTIWVWDYFIMLEPELVEIRKPLVGSHQPKFYLRPSRDMEELVNRLESNDPEYQSMQFQIPESLREKIKKKDLIQLDENTVSVIQNLTDASATRGTPPYQRLFTTFIQEDFTRLAYMAQANRYHFPMEMWTLGDLEKNILPNTADLDRLRDLVTDAIQQPPFSLFLPPIVKYEALGVQGKTFPFKDDYDYIWQQYMVGLGVSANLILGDSGIFSSAETSSNQAFIRARKKERDQLEDWMTWQFFEPLARWNNLRIKRGNQLVPILPDYEWEKTLDYNAEAQEREDVKFLWEKGVFPTKTLLGKLRENPEEIEKGLEAELDTVFDDGKRIAAPSVRKKKTEGGAGGAGIGETEAGPGSPMGDREKPSPEAPAAGGPEKPPAEAPAAETPSPTSEASAAPAGPTVTEAPEIL